MNKELINWMRKFAGIRESEAIRILHKCADEAIDSIAKLSIYASPSSSNLMYKNDAIEAIEKRMK